MISVDEESDDNKWFVSFFYFIGIQSEYSDK